MAVGFRQKYKAPTAVDTLISGITKANVALPICTVRDYCNNGVDHLTYVKVNSLLKATAADAALGFGQKIMTLPRGFVQPKGAVIKVTITTPTGLSSTAGECSLGSVVCSGAVSVTSGTATFQDLIDGKTLTGNTSGSTVVDTLLASGGGTSGTETPYNGDTTACPVHLNIASTWDQTAAESITFSAEILFAWAHFGTLT